MSDFNARYFEWMLKHGEIVRNDDGLEWAPLSESQLAVLFEYLEV